MKEGEKGNHLKKEKKIKKKKKKQKISPEIYKKISNMRVPRISEVISKIDSWGRKLYR